VKQVMRSALIVIAAQYLAVIVGVYWGRDVILRRQLQLIPRGWTGLFRLLDALSPYCLRGRLPAPTLQGVEWIPVFHLEGPLAALALAVAGLRVAASPRLRRTHRQRMWLCLSLFCYVVWLMYLEPFYDYRGDISFIIGVLLLTPVLLAMSPLVRCCAWLGLSGAMLFLATSLAMIIDNACSRGGCTGFFCAEVW